MLSQRYYSILEEFNDDLEIICQEIINLREVLEEKEQEICNLQVQDELNKQD